MHFLAKGGRQVIGVIGIRRARTRTVPPANGPLRLRALAAVGLLAAFLLLLAAAPAQAEFGFITKWGSNGSGDGQFRNPGAIATDAAGNVYVGDQGLNRIQKFTSGGRFITKWGREGSDNGQFSGISPKGVAIGPSGNAYVSDQGFSTDRIQMFTPDGAFMTKWGRHGSGDGQFDLPEGMATDAAGSVYVADSYNHRIQKFTANGDFLLTWGWGVRDGRNAFQICPRGCQKGIFGSGKGQFNTPYGVATDAAGNVYIAESHRVQKFASNGKFITKWGGRGSGNGEFEEGRHGIATDAAGNVYVTDSYRVQKFSPSGKFLAKWGSHGAGKGQFEGASGVATDDGGNVYVTDVLNSRIQKFGIVPGTKITDGPKGRTHKRSATFRFRADEPGASFKCKLDDRRWGPCSSPKTYKGLSKGKHVFRVRASKGQRTGSAAKRKWRVVRASGGKLRAKTTLLRPPPRARASA